MKISYFTALIFYEPILGKFLKENPNLTRSFFHPFKMYFYKKNVFYYPKILILQSSFGNFEINKNLLNFFFEIIYKPYINCKHTIILSDKNSKKKKSIIAQKEFLLSLFFSLTEKKEKIQTYTIKNKKLEIDKIIYKKYKLDKNLYFLIKELLINPLKSKILIYLFFGLILESKIYIRHKNPGLFLRFIKNLIIP